MKPVSKLMSSATFLGLALLLCAGSASAQMYKWVDANGKTHFTDQPPPQGAKPVALKGAVGSATSDMPYALATAMRNYPVTLYTSRTCAPCERARSYLKGRGIPFSELTVTTSEDDAKMRSAGGDGNLPFIIVGSVKDAGFTQSKWESILNVALYPATKVLPSSYQYPPAVAAAPVAPKVVKPDPEAAKLAAEEEERRRRESAAPVSNAPPGFRF